MPASHGKYAGRQRLQFEVAGQRPYGQEDAHGHGQRKESEGRERRSKRDAKSFA